jgi:hypothetical protein
MCLFPDITTNLESLPSTVLYLLQIRHNAVQTNEGLEANDHTLHSCSGQLENQAAFTPYQDNPVIHQL